MKAHLINTHLLVPRSRSSAKVNVKYQGHVSQKMGVSGALVFHKHILFLSSIAYKTYFDFGKKMLKMLVTSKLPFVNCECLQYGLVLIFIPRKLGILEPAVCLSVCPSIRVSICVQNTCKLCHKLLLQFYFNCIKTLHIH